MNFKIISIIFLILRFSACNITKKSKPEKEKLSSIIEKRMIADGFKKGHFVIDKTKDLPCRNLIQLENGSLLQGIINLKQRSKINKTLIWVKYLPQRRMSICNAMPVKIINIKKRSR